MSAKIILNTKAEKSIERRHPWIFSGAVQSVKGSPQDGDIVKVFTTNQDFAVRGYWNSQSQIQVRVLSWDADEVIDRDFWKKRLQRAIAARDGRLACRLVHGESDYLPGLIVDRYGDWLVVQALTLGIDTRKELIADILAELLAPRGIYERSDADVRRLEGLPETKGVLWGEAPPDPVIIEENGIQYLVDIQHGQKTGFYLDQRDNRQIVHDLLLSYPDPAQLSVLNAFSYTGGFTMNAYQAGVRDVTSVDSADGALGIAKRIATLNGFAASPEQFIHGDVFAVLREYRQVERRFDVIVLDPPKFASNARQVERASRGYKDINLIAFQLLKPGGHLVTFSCSNAITDDLFQKIVFGALLDSKRDGQIIRRLHAADDHPIALTFPEGSYLKGLVCRVW